jgi:hypothetical protein
MIRFFCSVCIEDVDLNPTDMCITCCEANCPECGTLLKSLYARPENPTDEMLGLAAYNEINGIDNNTP